MARYSIVSTLGFLGLLCLVGCSESEPIRRYQVPKPHVLDKLHGVAPAAGRGATDASGTGNRMLAAIVPRGDRAWFFKVTGPAEAIVKQLGAFDELIKSLKFPKAGADGQPAEPQWTLPEGWKQLPATGMRYATLQMGPDESAPQLSVTTLPWEKEDETAAILANVNRWRGQLQLPPIGPVQLPSQCVQFQVDGATATVVNLADGAGNGK